MNKPRIEKPAIVASLQYLHPKAVRQFQELSDDLERAHEAGVVSCRFIPFETYRSPVRQEILYSQRPPVTKTRAWHSAHQYGLAVDYVAFDDEPWGDHHPWDFLKERAEKHGLEVPIKWDRGHVQHPFYKLIPR